MHEEIIIGNSTQVARIVKQACLERGLVDGSRAYRLIYRNLKEFIANDHYIGNRKYCLNGLKNTINQFFEEVSNV